MQANESSRFRLGNTLDPPGEEAHRRQVAGERRHDARGDVEGEELVAPQLPPRHVPEAPQRKHVELRQRRQPHVGLGLKVWAFRACRRLPPRHVPEAPQRKHVELRQRRQPHVWI
jgi:hypothetical protein